MLVCTLAVALLLRWASHRQRFVSLCENASWRICFEFEYEENGRRSITFDKVRGSVVMPMPYGPEFLRDFLGLAYFNRIRGVHANLNTEADHNLFRRLSSQPSITFLRIEEGKFRASDVKTVTSLADLRLLHIDTAAMTAEEIRDLTEVLHPECELYIRRMEPPTE